MISSNFIESAWWLSGLLLTLSIKVLLLAAFVWAGLAIARVQSATWRHRAWLFCLVAMLGMPVLSFLAPAIPVSRLPLLAWMESWESSFSQLSEPATAPVTTAPVVSAPVVPASVEKQPASVPQSVPLSDLEPKRATPVPLQSSVGPRAAGQADMIQTPAVEPPGSTQPPSSLLSGGDLLVVTLALIYLAGSLVLALRLACSVWYCQRLVRRSQPVKLPAEVQGLVSSARVVQSAAVNVPLCQGIVNSTIILPEDWETWERSLLAMVLSHEAEHIRRRDPLVSFLAALGTIFYWFHPVSWRLQRTLSDLAEHACDDAVIGNAGERTDYARILLEMSSRVTPSGRRYQQLGVSMTRKPEIEDRIERVIDTARPLSERIGLKASTLLLVFIATVALVTAGLTIATTAQARAAEKTPPQEARQQLTGIVLTPAGQPVKNAEVRLRTYNKSKSRYDHRTTRTDDHGKFHFDHVLPGNNRIAAYWKNMASRQQRYQGLKVKPGDEVELKLAPANTLEVQVLKEADGRPVPEARVHFPWHDMQSDYATNAADTAVIHGLTPEEWTFEVLAKGYEKNTQTINLSGEETTRVTVKLKPGFTLYGTVRDEAGKPVPGAGIDARVPGDSSNRSGGYMKTDAKGRYRFETLPLQSLDLSVRKDGYEMISPRVNAIPRPMGERKFDITLPKRKTGGAIRGTITDAQGHPIAGARLSNMGRSSTQTRETTSNAQGKYQLEDLCDLFGRYEIVVQADGFAPQQLLVTPGAPPSPATYHVTMQPGRTIAGKVVDSDGKPLKGVWISYEGPDGHELNMRRSTKTNAQGEFTFDSLTQLAPLTFVLSGYSTITNRDFPAEENKPVVVTMKSEGILRGKVVDDSTGKPVTDYKVQITFSPIRKPNDPQGILSGARVMNGERIVNARGEFELRKFVQGMPLQVTIRADGYQKEVHVRVLARAASGAPMEEYRLTPLDPAMLHTFAGKVVTADGKPVPGVQLRLIAASMRRTGGRNEFPFNWAMVQNGNLKSVAQVAQFLSATTNAEGQFEFKNVNSSPDIELAYWGGGVAQGRLPGLERFDKKQRTTIVIKTQATGSLRGKVNRQRFKTISHITLSGEDTFYNATLSADGTTYEIKDVSPGTYQIQIYAPEQERLIGDRTSRGSDVVFRLPVKISAGEEQTANLGMEIPPPIQEMPAAKSEEPKPTAPPLGDQAIPQDKVRLAGQVMTPAGKGIPGARLWLPTSLRKSIIETRADDQGRFSILVPRKVIAEDKIHFVGTLWGFAPGHQIGTANVYRQLRELSRDPVALILGPATNTAFEVRDIYGKPIAGVRVDPWSYKIITLGASNTVPEPIRQLIGGVTDVQGNVKLPTCNRELLYSLLSTGEGYGEQQNRLPSLEQAPGIVPIVLKPTGRVLGTLSAETPVDFSGCIVYVDSESRGINSSKGTAYMETDASGQFSIPELAEGRYRIYARFPDDNMKLRAVIPDVIEVVAGKTTRATIPFKPTITARGIIQTMEEKTPISGAWISVRQGGRLNSQNAFSDKEGVYTAELIPGEEVGVQLISKPREYADWIQLGRILISDQVPAAAKEFQLPTIELAPTFPLAGKLIDAYDRPVGGATILAGTRGKSYSRATSDAEGKFTLQFPKDFRPEEYSIVLKERSPGSVTAKVVSESPLVLQLP
ncbi:carboxypeptidase regulatory-like domain-containing protein [Gimesia chilikensis]|uniref:Regulatory protein BlaR1 n=1 Tax=Gimesia chilikensis TaxID=2605989 RepID=A0A517PPU0_9PLAN|nr:carboxypeptidase regulatory-like domain-containing protein [Gimesia chilikensis]QDT21380.1 Regulatory protein BlaR1 [Gimesia chilikensis]